MPDRLIDNQTLRLSEAINQVAPHATKARFAVGYFFLSGFEAIADSFAGLDHVQLLIGSVTNRRTIEELALGYRRRELIEEKLRQERFTDVNRAIDETAAGIRKHLSELQPGEEPERTIKTLAEMIPAAGSKLGSLRREYCTPRLTSSITAISSRTRRASPSSAPATSRNRASRQTPSSTFKWTTTPM